MIHTATLKIHKYAPFVCLGFILEAELTTDLLYSRFNFLHMVYTVVALSDNDV